MTEFEAATVAYQQATLSYQQGALALQQGALALQQSQFWAAVAIPLVAFVVGAGQIIVVAIGIRVMRRTADQREKREDHRHAEAMEALRQQADALRVLIERTAPPRKGDAQ